jgi:hypothetical protein
MKSVVLINILILVGIIAVAIIFSDRIYKWLQPPA